MVFGVVFMEKNRKQKKKQDTFENLLLHISITEAL
jgi:predicted transcriptional regulator